MTPTERLEELESWLLDEYNATLDVWKEAESPSFRSVCYSRLQTLASVAYHMVAVRDGRPPTVLDDRYLLFTHHQRIDEIWPTRT